MTQWHVTVAGAGKIGRMIATLLARTGHYEVVVVDRDDAALRMLAEAGHRTAMLDLSDADTVATFLRGSDAIISAAPFFLTPTLATAAKAAGAHYFDLTEDVAATRAVRELAAGAETAFMPQCGLAPGFVSIAGYHLARGFDEIEDLTLRVGALPRYPTNALKYNLTWSTDGLINEYCNPCEALVDGEMVELAPLEGREAFALDGVDYEAFNTSGGLGSLAETLGGKARNVAYRTIRYPGHRDIVRLLLHDLGLVRRRDLLKDVFETALPMTKQDVVLIFCTASGRRGGLLEEESFLKRVEARQIGDETWSAIQIATAAGVTGVVDLMRRGDLPARGFVRQEEVSLADFLATPFGRLYDGGNLDPCGVHDVAA